MKDKTLTWIQTGAIVILIICVISMNSKINNIENMTQNNQNQINSISGQMNMITSDIGNMTEEEKFIQGYEYNIENVNGDYTLADVNVELRFNEIERDADVYYTYRSTSVLEDILYLTGFYEEQYEEPTYGEWVKAPLSAGDDGSYTGTIRLSYAQNYECKVVIETETLIKTEDLGNMPLYNKSKPMYDLDFNLESYSSDGAFTYHANLYAFGTWNEVELADVTCILYYQNEQIDQFDLMNEGELIEDNEEMRYWIYDGEGKVEDGSNFESDFDVSIIVTDTLGRSFEHVWQIYDY